MSKKCSKTLYKHIIQKNLVNSINFTDYQKTARPIFISKGRGYGGGAFFNLAVISSFNPHLFIIKCTLPYSPYYFMFVLFLHQQINKIYSWFSTCHLTKFSIIFGSYDFFFILKISAFICCSSFTHP